MTSLMRTLTSSLWERLWYHCQKSGETVVWATGEHPRPDQVNLDACIAHLEQALSVAKALKIQEQARCERSSLQPC